MRKYVSRFASWAIMNQPFEKEKHYLKERSICFDVKEGEEYANHIEMSGYYCSTIISYGADKNGFLRRVNHAVFPSLRTYPNDTYGSFDYNFEPVFLCCDGKRLDEKVEKFVFDGVLHVWAKSSGIAVYRRVFVAPNAPALMEIIEVNNQKGEEIFLQIKHDEQERITERKHG